MNTIISVPNFSFFWISRHFCSLLQDQKIISIMVERKEAERLREERRDQTGPQSARPRLERPVSVRAARPASYVEASSSSTPGGGGVASRTSHALRQQSADVGANGFGDRSLTVGTLTLIGWRSLATFDW